MAPPLTLALAMSTSASLKLLQPQLLLHHQHRTHLVQLHHQPRLENAQLIVAQWNVEVACVGQTASVLLAMMDGCFQMGIVMRVYHAKAVEYRPDGMLDRAAVALMTTAISVSEMPMEILAGCAEMDGTSCMEDVLKHVHLGWLHQESIFSSDGAWIRSHAGLAGYLIMLGSLLMSISGVNVQVITTLPHSVTFVFIVLMSMGSIALDATMDNSYTKIGALVTAPQLDCHRTSQDRMGVNAARPSPAQIDSMSMVTRANVQSQFGMLVAYHAAGTMENLFA